MGLLLLMIWVWLVQNPAVAVHVIPPAILSNIEGTGGAPIFMLVIGIAWARARLARQRWVALVALGAGALYFVHGGQWMLQSTPVLGFNEQPQHHLFMQSQDFSCVPAACATALWQLGIPSSEGEMAALTRTRPGTGSTLVRALHGLNRRLEGHRYKAVILAPPRADLERLPTPMLTPLRVTKTQEHMVTILKVRPDGVWLADPIDGLVWMYNPNFDAVYTRQVIVFDDR